MGRGADRAAPAGKDERAVRPHPVVPLVRRGLSRVDSAAYIGVSPSKFDQLVDDGRMPGPKRIDGRKVWDIRQLDLAFDELPGEDEGANSWDRVLR